MIAIDTNEGANSAETVISPPGAGRSLQEDGHPLPADADNRIRAAVPSAHEGFS
jgi:hypothetical protein